MGSDSIAEKSVRRVANLGKVEHIIAWRRGGLADDWDRSTPGEARFAQLRSARQDGRRAEPESERPGG